MRTFLFLSIIVLASSCSSFSKVQKSTDYEYKLRMAEKYYVAKKYNYASQLYQELFPIFKGSTKFEDLFYKYAYCSFYLKDWLQAENLFKQFTEVFPTSVKAEEMEYMRSYTYYVQSPKVELDQTNSLKTIGLMQTFINTHPNSAKNAEANAIIEKLRAKLEEKDYLSAELYYNMGHYRAAAIAFSSLMNNFPDTKRGDEYKLQVIKSYFLYAQNSIEDKKPARYEQVVTEVNDFTDRYPESSHLKDAERYASLSQENIKQLQNEQVKTSNQR
ncbi:MAG: outer membrane protein assembly factor BamD [Chitinophagaceae bacterium]|nr:outer membrane protein assembly factor BamD [Chitinophagaceae bacterium]